MPASGPRADHDRRDPDPVAVEVDPRRLDVVVEPAPVVPGEEDRRLLPVGTAHRRVDDLRHVALALPDGLARLRVLADARVRHHPGHGRQRAVPRRGEVLLVTHDVAELALLADRREPRQRVLLRDRALAALVRGTRTRTCRRRRSTPSYVLLVEQVRDVGPREERHVLAALLRLVLLPQLEVRRAAHRVARVVAVRRPRRDEEQVRRQRPRVRRREQAVLQDELPRVRPVVRDLAPGQVAHDVGLALRPEVRGARGVVAVVGAVDRRVDRALDEPVHPPAVHVDGRVALRVRPALLELRPRVVRREAPAGDRVVGADRRTAVPHRDPVRAGERAEVVIERPVLLHDEDQVLEVLLRQLGSGEVLPVVTGHRRRVDGRARPGRRGAAALRRGRGLAARRRRSAAARAPSAGRVASSGGLRVRGRVEDAGGGIGSWSKSNSRAGPRGYSTSSRTVGRESGRLIVAGSRRAPPRNRSSISFRYASNVSVCESIVPAFTHGLIIRPGTRIP